jgi:hypothetical protein
MSKSSKFPAIVVNAFTLKNVFVHRIIDNKVLRERYGYVVVGNAVFKLTQDGRTVTQRRRRYVCTTQLTSVYPTP